MTTAKQIKKGCGKLPCESSYTHCGKVSDITKKKVICNGCKARLSQYKSDLQRELEFLKNSFCNKCCSSCMYNVEGRIIEIEKELKEIGK